MKIINYAGRDSLDFGFEVSFLYLNTMIVGFDVRKETNWRINQFAESGAHFVSCHKF